VGGLHSDTKRSFWNSDERLFQNETRMSVSERGLD